jgi:photosystem II stability/assembly factor-like uncharacterized protein
MTRPDLERELRDHYLSLDGGSPGAASRVAAALDRAPARRRWSIGRSMPSRALVAACSALVVVALVAAALLLPGHGSPAGPDVSSTASPGAAGTPVATQIATPFVRPTPATPTPTIDPARAKVSDAGMTRAGLIWALRDTGLDISTDNGQTWHENPLPAGSKGANGTIKAIAVVDPDTAFVAVGMSLAAGPGAKSSKGITTIAIYRTQNGGATWQTLKAKSFEGDVFVELLFVDANAGFAVVEPVTSGPTTIMHTLDGGANWTVTSSTALGYVRATDANTLWSMSNSVGEPLLRVSRDAGATWSTVPLPGVGAKVTLNLEVLPGWQGPVQFVSPMEGFLAVRQMRPESGECGVLYYRTMDGGRSWSQVAALQRCPLGGPIVLDATHWLQDDKPTQGARLLATSDGGQTWTSAGDASAGYNALTVDGKSWAKKAQVDPDSDINHSYFALLLSRDGGVTWQPADFSVR